MLRRTFTSSASLLKKSSFDKNLGVSAPAKAWQRGKNQVQGDKPWQRGKNQAQGDKPWQRGKNKVQGDKAAWFKAKYAHVHAEQKKRPSTDPYGKRAAYDEKVRQQRRDQRDARNEHRMQYTSSRQRRTSVATTSPLFEYLYGKNAVGAAVKSAGRRSGLTRLLVHGNEAQKYWRAELANLQLEEKLPLVVSDKHQLSQLSKGNPHNNVVLETRPLQLDVAVHLDGVDASTGKFSITVQDQESDAAIFSDNAQEATVQRDLEQTAFGQKRFPVGVLLDNVVDPHNVGAVVRSAYFLGADFVVATQQDSARLSPTVAKASSGALECLPFYRVGNPAEFIKASQRPENGGWTFVTAHCASGQDKTLPLADLSSLSANSPTVLVVGNEGTGPRASVRGASDYLVEIPNRRSGSIVESLNVSVATALLLHQMLE
ncbi:Mrm1 protein [Maudiozyma humilis]|uniref:rRNA methyltransferase 1, mitochondrial n=1 Tax=Maudiozyma humilis TaxID=51915 RepID=A0AAV5S7X4_MAUHU|nr:Mrm1 protein [Kazachstania humilis]